MKQLLLFALATVYAVTGMAQSSNLVVFNEEGNPFYLILNGVRQNADPQTNVKVTGLTNAFYNAKIIYSNQALGEVEKKNLAVSDPESGEFGEVTYLLRTDKKGGQTIRFQTFTPAAQVPPPPPTMQVVQYNTTPMPAPILGVQVTETTTTTVGRSDNVNVGMNVGGVNMGINVNINDGMGTHHSSTTTTTTTTVVGTTTHAAPAPVAAVPVCTPMDEGNFQSLIGTINKKSWDEDKLAIAKQATSSNCFTANQVKRIMNTFGWEDTKLDYAKFAYPYCYDKNNYFQVNDAFEWSDSVNKLNNSIGR
jgi:hypothetical protein